MAEASVARRLAPEQRKALLIGAAEETFVARGYTQAGLAEVAENAGVSKTLLYHYFPDGRPELYRRVMDRLAGEVVEAVRSATQVQAGRDRRLADAVTALVTWFEEHPDAYRLLILEPWGSGDPTVVGKAMAVRAQVAGELNALLAPAGQSLEATQVGGAAALGAVLQVCELAMSGQVPRQQAIELGQRFVAAGPGGLDPV